MILNYLQVHLNHRRKRVKLEAAVDQIFPMIIVPAIFLPVLNQLSRYDIHEF